MMIKKIMGLILILLLLIFQNPLFQTTNAAKIQPGTVEIYTKTSSSVTCVDNGSTQKRNGGTCVDKPHYTYNARYYKKKICSNDGSDSCSPSNAETCSNDYSGNTSSCDSNGNFGCLTTATELCNTPCNSNIYGKCDDATGNNCGNNCYRHVAEDCSHYCKNQSNDCDINGNYRSDNKYHNGTNDPNDSAADPVDDNQDCGKYTYEKKVNWTYHTLISKTGNSINQGLTGLPSSKVFIGNDGSNTCHIEVNVTQGAPLSSFTQKYKTYKDANYYPTSKQNHYSAGGNTNHNPNYQEIKCSNLTYYEGLDSSADDICQPPTDVNKIISQTNIDQRTPSVTYVPDNNSDDDDNDNICKVQGRAAKVDNEILDGNLVSLNNQVKDVFNLNNLGQDIWCNIKKYRKEGTPPFDYANSGMAKEMCDKYKVKNIRLGVNTDTNEDLLKGLQITIPGDKSGIGSIKVELGSCTAYTYEVLDKSLANIVKAPYNNNNGVKDNFTQDFTIKYNNSSGRNNLNSVPTSGSQAGQLKGLKQIFNKDRLDECLGEGANYLLVTVTDMVRDSSGNGTSLHSNPNTNTFEFGPIYIDTIAPKINITNDLLKADLTQYASYQAEGYRKWMNRSLFGEIKFGEGDGTAGQECPNFQIVLPQGDCILAGFILPADPSDPTQSDLNSLYIGPAGVDSRLGTFQKFQCGEIGSEISFPIAAEDCRIGCTNHFIYKSSTNECIEPGFLCVGKTQGGKIYAGAFPGGWLGADLVEDHLVLDANDDDDCLPYCSPGHTMGCIVKK